jgi:oxygen-independent coproporphyrinogen-3 oxidase
MTFPGELPRYDDDGDVASAAARQPTGKIPERGDCDASAVVKLRYGGKYATASTVIQLGGRRFYGTARVRLDALRGKLESDRLLQSAVKRAFFKAAVSATGEKPVWGSLTGIRPSKLPASMLKLGASPAAARRELTRRMDVSQERAALCTETARRALDVGASLSPGDVALYVGIPFCPTRCAYCSFVSRSVERSTALIEPFLGALDAEIRATADTARSLGLRVRSLYIGGGTPTVLSAGQLGALLGSLERSFDLSYLREYSVEAGRPDTISADKLSVMRAFGVGRVSVNPQTMSDSVLEAIGRRHTSADSAAAMALARAAGFASVNADIIAGLPTDTPEGFSSTLSQVTDFFPENITVHTLSLKKGSRLTLEKTAVPGAAEVSSMLETAGSRLRAAGYGPYYLYRQKYMSGGFENVGWSIPGNICEYNICMMEELCTVLSVGGGAVTKLVSAESGRINRLFNPKYPYEYIQAIRSVLEKKKEIEVFYHGI